MKFKIVQILDNKHLGQIYEPGYVLKVTNHVDSQNPAIYDSQNKIMSYLRGKDLSVPEAIVNKQGDFMSVETTLFPGNSHVVRVLKFLPGTILYSVPKWTTNIFFDMGDYVGRLTKALYGYTDPVLSERVFMWQLKFVQSLKPDFYTNSFTQDPDKLRLIDSIIECFMGSDVFNPMLEKGIIHGDFNEQNVLLNKDNQICGLIDFGDVHEAPLIFELALTIMYAMTKSNVIPPNEVGGHVIAGYLRHRRLSDMERKILKVSVAGRYAQSLVLGAYSHEKYPTNDYLVVTANTGWNTLKAFWEDSNTDQLWDKIILSYN
eukprot:TRINITY_DN18718_c0_g1_i1.p1 TRINITY_DN18718_c0_g1~~TRINITY_DN18718_c0_g1_i1.p1  ORF type:complete len:353 (+),score=30.81 TRINITY_DN18718_c0_g1_i1:106-1059(+)